MFFFFFFFFFFFADLCFGFEVCQLSAHNNLLGPDQPSVYALPMDDVPLVSYLFVCVQ